MKSRTLTALAILMAATPALLAGQAEPASSLGETGIRSGPARCPADHEEPLSRQGRLGRQCCVLGRREGSPRHRRQNERRVRRPALLAEIGKVTPLPVTTLVITHSDGDHINGLPGFPKGLTIVAHEKCRDDIAAAAETQPELKDYLPTRTYTDRLELVSGSNAVILAHFGPAHTSGDTVVFFPADKAVFVGDLLFVGRDPLIHRHKGGQASGAVRTLEGLLALEPRIETFLSGHADPVGRAEVEALKVSMADRLAKVKAMVAAGQSLEEIKKAFGIDDPPDARVAGAAG